MEGLEAPILALIWFAVFIFSLTVHEAGHALAAKLLGDPTAYHGGQVTLNPRPHMEREPLGTVIVPVLSYTIPQLLGGQGFMMGWASAPYDPLWAARYPRRAALMALAGPAGNMVLVILAWCLIRGGLAAGWFIPPSSTSQLQIMTLGSGGEPTAVSQLLSILYVLNLILMLFNLLPLPPLDGSAVIQLFMREETAVRWQEFLRQPAFALMGLILAWQVFGRMSSTLFLAALQILYPGYGYH